MAVVALVAAMSRPDFTPLSLLPLGVGVVVWTILLDFLTGAARPRPTLEASRRRFLLNAGGVAVAAVAVAAGGRLVGRCRAAVEASRRLLRLPVTRGAVPAGADERSLGRPGAVAGAEQRLLPDRHRAGACPRSTPASWRLRIHGLVDREITIELPRAAGPAG